DSRSIRRFTVPGVAFAGANKTGIYVQYDDGSVRFSTDLKALDNIPKMTLAASPGSPKISHIIDYKGGSLIVTDKGVYTSSTPGKLFSGEGVQKIMEGNPGITSIVNYRGENVIDKYKVTVDRYKNEKFVSRETKITQITREETLGV